MKRTFLCVVALAAFLGMFSPSWAWVPSNYSHQQSGSHDLSTAAGSRDYSTMDNPDYYYAAIKSAPSDVFYRQAGFNPARDKIVAQRQYIDGAVSRKEVVLMDADGSNEIYISPGDSGEGDIYGYMNPFWSDDGTVIGFAEVHNTNPNKIIRYNLATSTREYIYEPVGSDACNPDFVGGSTSTIVFWDWIAADGAADLFTWDGTNLTNITNSTLYSEYEPVSNSDGSVILYWSGETTTEPVNTTHTLSYSGGSWVVDSGFTPITDTYWSFWSGQSNNNIGVVVMSTLDVHIYTSTGSFLYDVTGPGYSGGSGQWNFIGFNYEGNNGELLLTSNAGRTEAGRDIIIANPRTKLYVGATGSDAYPGTEGAPFATVSKAVSVAVNGGLITVDDGTYNENVAVNKNITLKSVNGAASTIIDGVAGSPLGAIQLTSGRNGVTIGAVDHGFTVKGIDGTAGLEKAAIYLQGSQTNITIEGNIIEARGDAGLMGEYNAANNGIVINANTFSGKTFLGDNPAGVGFGAQYTLLNVPRQLVVFGGGKNTTNTQNITFTNNIISGAAGGMSITNDSGQPISPTPQGNTLVTLDLAGTNVITGNTFSGYTNRYAEAMRVRGAGAYTISGNNFNGSYPANISSDTSTPSVGIARIADAYANNTFAKAAIVKDASLAIKVNTIPTLINGAIALAANTDIVVVSAGTYPEDVDVSKSITLSGAGAATTIIQGVWGGNGQTVMINADNATVENFTITRTGNNTTDWNNASLNSTGLQIQNSRTGCVVQNCIFTGNRNAVYLNDTRNHIIQNNVIDFNRTGLQLVNNVSGVQVLNNQITNNWTLGVLIYHQSAGQAASTGVLINNNKISGNWYSQIECKVIQANPTVSYDCTANWLGAATPYAVTTLAGETGYAGLIPVEYGGTSVSPGTNEGKISGEESAKVLYDPWWANAAMTLVGSNAPVQNVTRNLFYQTVQEAIDAAYDGEHITVAAGTFDQTMNFAGKTGISITGAGEGITIFKPSTVIPWNYFGHTTGRRSAIRIVESQDITIEGITLDCDLIKNNGWHGVFYGNSTGCVLQASTLKNMYTDQAHYYDIMLYARALEPFSNAAKATLNILDCDLIDTGRVGIVTHDYMHTVIDGNAIYKTTHTFGYAMEIGSSSTAEITDNVIHGFDTPAVSDGSTSGGIYIENCYTQAFTTPVAKPVVISGNQVYGCQMGIMAGNQFNNYAGDVDIALQISGNILTDNIDYGIMLTDEDHANGSSVTAVLTGNNISSTLDTPDAIGIMVYGTGDADLDVTLTSNMVSGYDYDLFVYDWGTDPNSSEFVLNATGNTFSDAEYGVYTGLVNWIPLRVDNPLYSGNTFSDNTIHMDNSSGEAINMDTVLANNTFVGGAYQFDQIIYSSSADVVYVDADYDLIHDAEQQPYYVKVLTVEDLRAFTVQVKIPQAYFDVPSGFAIGPLFAAYPEGTFFMSCPVPDPTNTYWIYNVTGSYLGGYDGIDGSDVVLFSFSATSLADVDNTPDGCMIEVPFDEIELRDDQDPYSGIAVLASEGFNVIIDCVEPAIDHTNDDVYPTGYLLSVLGDGSGNLNRPTLTFSFTDNYNLGNTMYLIQAEGLDAPTLPAAFSLPLDLVDGELTDVAWQLDAQVNALDDGTYTLYILVVDDADNFSIFNWDFIIDSTPPDPVEWDATIPCRTTARQNNSIDLKWANPEGTVKNHIWVLGYTGLVGGYTPPDTAYPEYPTTTNAIPAAPNPYSLTEQNGWNQFIVLDPPVMPYKLTGMERDYYYITIFAEDASGNISVAPIAPYYRESISYWPGDVTGEANGITHTVTSADIGVLSPVWGLAEGDTGWDNTVDVGPTVDNGRRSRPEPDNVIDIEDLMIFAMNYNNTVYTYYQREGEDDLQPIQIEMQYAIQGDKLHVNLYLLDNQDYVRGLNIPLAYGSGLILDSVLNGDIWPDNSLLLHKNKDGLFVFSGSVLGDQGAITGNGLLATVLFKTQGPDTSIGLRHMVARGIMNEEMEILNNPNDITTDNEDPVNVVPVSSYLGNNFPNPFNPSTTVSFGLCVPGNVRVSIYNARGQHIRTLVNGTMQAGNHTVVWNGTDDNNRSVSSGIYFIRMETKNYVSTKKALMIK